MIGFVSSCGSGNRDNLIFLSTSEEGNNILVCIARSNKTICIAMKNTIFLPLLFIAQLIVVGVHSLSSQQLLSERLGNKYSLLTTTKWKIRLDVGLQPGTWMPKRFPGWAESGARLVVDADIEFTDDMLPNGERGEPLIGPKEQTGIVKVNHLNKDNNNNNNNKSYNPSTFVSEKGTQNVTFTKGGWCIQRPTADIKNSDGVNVQPGGILGFWLDCESGATRRDVDIPPNTRIFFTTGVWDDPAGLVALEEEYKVSVDELQVVEERTRETRSATKEKNWFGQIADVRQMVLDADEYDKLKSRKEMLERRSPPKSSTRAKNGVQIAPTGSLVIKGNQNIPDWMPTSEYLILGTFSATKSLS